MKEFLKIFFSSPAYAVVGASENREKYGNIVYRYLRDKQFPVFPVNPHCTTIEGDTCYATVGDLPDAVKSVVLVVPPEVTERIVKECNAKGIAAVWMQPGAESSAAIAYATQHGLAEIHDACVMVLLGSVRTYSGLSAWLDFATKHLPA